MEEIERQDNPVARTPAAWKLEVSTRWKRIKTWLNCSIILVSVVQMALAGVQTANETGWGAYWIFIGPVTPLSIGWSSTELITQRLARRNRKPTKRYRGIHPGAHVGMQLGLIAGQGTCGGLIIPSEICDPERMTPCVTPEIEVVVGTLAFVLSILHFVLFVRACIETHRLRTLSAHGIEFVPSPDDKGGEDLPEVAALQKHGNAPVVVPVSIAGEGGTTNVYMVTGPDGRPQLLAPVGTRLVVMPSEGSQQAAAVEAGSAQIYELNVPGRINELDARQGNRAESGA